MSTNVFTIANQLTLLRMLLIPAFVILTLYGEFGWALATFAFAGLTDLLDGLAARATGQKSELGAWLGICVVATSFGVERYPVTVFLSTLFTTTSISARLRRRSARARRTARCSQRC